MMVLSVLASLALAGPAGVLGAGDTAVMTTARHAKALPQAALTAGRVGGLPALRIQVLQDRVTVAGNNAVILEEGTLPDDGEYFVRPLYERLSEVTAGRLERGAEAPFAAVVALDGRVPMGTLDRILFTAQVVGVNQVAILVDDRSVREPWVASTLPSQSVASEAGLLTGLSISSEGIGLVGIDAGDRLLRRTPSLACSDCKTVDDLPWSALDTVLAKIATADRVGPRLQIDVAEANIAASAMVRALDAVGGLERPVVLKEMAEKPLGPGLVATGEPAAVPWGSRLEVASVLLPAPDEDVVVQPIPLAEVERAFFGVRGETSGCLALSGGEYGVSVVRLEIARDGTVGAATLTDDTFAKKGVGQCLLRVIRDLNFPEHAGNTSMVVARTFVVSAE